MICQKLGVSEQEGAGPKEYSISAGTRDMQGEENSMSERSQGGDQCLKELEQTWEGSAVTPNEPQAEMHLPD